MGALEILLHPGKSKPGRGGRAERDDDMAEPAGERQELSDDARTAIETLWPDIDPGKVVDALDVLESEGYLCRE